MTIIAKPVQIHRNEPMTARCDERLAEEPEPGPRLIEVRGRQAELVVAWVEPEARMRRCRRSSLATATTPEPIASISMPRPHLAAVDLAPLPASTAREVEPHGAGDGVAARLGGLGLLVIGDVVGPQPDDPDGTSVPGETVPVER